MNRQRDGTRGAYRRPSCFGGTAVSASLALALLLAASACAAEPPTREQPPDRLAPPGSLQCERNRLTSYSGEVLEYTRSPGRTRLVIGTEWQTVETVELEHPGTDDPSAAFLWLGQPFTAADWQRIESAAGALREDVRATAWVCEDGVTPPVIDWHPTR